MNMLINIKQGHTLDTCHIPHGFLEYNIFSNYVLSIVLTKFAIIFKRKYNAKLYLY